MLNELDNIQVDQVPLYKVISCGATDPGLVRHNNEDVWGELPELKLFAVADGMGGHRAGEVAAKEAIKSLFHFAKVAVAEKKITTMHAAKEMIKRAMMQANIDVYHLSRSEEHLRGMGTTLCCLYFHDEGVVTAHVGDSRIYRFRNNKLEQLTSDHSLMRELMDLGQLTENQASDFLYKNIITKAIGTELQVEPSLKTHHVVNGDQYLICSDGLTDLLTTEEMEKIIKEASNIREAVKKLIGLAKERGGYDNITVILAQVQENGHAVHEKR